MKIIRYQLNQPNKAPAYGVIEDEDIRPLQGEPFSELVFSGERIPLTEVRLLPPCLPGKIVGIGINYAPHALELNFEIPPEPLIFFKPPSAVIGPGEEIILPSMSSWVEYEGELGVVIGRKAKDVSREKAPDYVLGYTCFNDVTARDLQKRDGQFSRSKSFDTFAAFGPVIETEIDPANLELRTTLNGELRQKANTASLIRGVAELVSFTSRIMTLLPGDIIATGTPSGVGKLKSGDTVSVAIEGIGTLTNQVR